MPPLMLVVSMHRRCSVLRAARKTWRSGPAYTSLMERPVSAFASCMTSGQTALGQVNTHKQWLHEQREATRTFENPKSQIFNRGAVDGFLSMSVFSCRTLEHVNKI